MICYIYNADVWCEACAENIKANLRAKGLEPAEPDDEATYDSGEWPKGPYEDEESDSPQHCGGGPDCLDPYIWRDGSKSGKFLENPLTTEGEHYVREMHAESRSEVTTMWMDHYDLRCDVEATLYDARGVMIEVVTDDADKVADRVAEFILGGLAGSIKFKPVGVRR